MMIFIFNIFNEFLEDIAQIFCLKNVDSSILKEKESKNQSPL